MKFTVKYETFPNGDFEDIVFSYNHPNCGCLIQVTKEVVDIDNIAEIVQCVGAQIRDSLENDPVCPKCSHNGAYPVFCEEKIVPHRISAPLWFVEVVKPGCGGCGGSCGDKTDHERTGDCGGDCECR